MSSNLAGRTTKDQALTTTIVRAFFVPTAASQKGQVSLPGHADHSHDPGAAPLRSAEPADQGLKFGPDSVFHFQLLLQIGNGGLGFFNGAAQTAEQ